jgi:hypothetical protein
MRITQNKKKKKMKKKIWQFNKINIVFPSSVTNNYTAMRVQIYKQIMKIFTCY